MNLYKCVRLTFLFVVFLGFAKAEDETPPIYSQVEIELSKISMQRLAEIGLPLEHQQPENGRLRLPLSQYDLQKLDEHKVPYQVLIHDYAQYLADRNREEAKGEKQDSLILPPSKTKELERKKSPKKSKKRCWFR